MSTLTAHPAESEARQKIALMHTEEICTAWDQTEAQVISIDLACVRGWLMDELERRNRDGFRAWIDSTESSPGSFFLR